MLSSTFSKPCRKSCVGQWPKPTKVESRTSDINRRPLVSGRRRKKARTHVGALLVRYHVNFSFNFHLTAVLFSSYTCSNLFLTPALFSFSTCKTRFKVLKSFPFFLTFFIPLFLITLATVFYRLLREFLKRVNDEVEVGQGRSCIRNKVK